MATNTDAVQLVGDEAAVNVARAALFAALMGAFAFVSFPNPLAPQVPVTLQVLGVFLAGIYLGPLWGGVAMSLYLLAGGLGLPVFAGGSATGALFGATAGYLWSYPVAAAAIGVIVHGTSELRQPNTVSLLRLVGAMVVGTIIIYAAGIVGLMVVTGMGLVAATVAGAASFIPFEAVKIAAAVGIVRSEAIAAE